MNTDTLAAWELAMKGQGLSPRTVTERLATVRMMLERGAVDGPNLTPDHIRVFLARRMSPATRATYHASIRAYCAWMLRAGIRDDNPADATDRPRRPKTGPRPIRSEQMKALMAKANRQRTRDYIALAALAGLRVHEIAKIHGRDLDPWTYVLNVVGKNSKQAEIPLHPDLHEMADRMPRDGYWFPAYSAQGNGEHVTSHAVSAAIRGAMQRAGFDGKPHQLRHSYGTNLVRAGVHMRVVQKLMRHDSPASTAIYTAVEFDQLQEGVSRLDSLAA